jgi:3-dehydroquinate synthase
MDALKAKDYTIHFNNAAYVALQDYIENACFSKIFIVMDALTQTHCYPIFKEKFKTSKSLNFLNIGMGENAKDIETCVSLWQQLCDLEADRNSLIVNLGGGVVTDLGGFVASTLKRGISFINIPTTLLGMVDASIGGKTGINLGALKNQVGCFSNPKMIIIDTDYLKTLDPREMRSGMAEIIKYGLSYDAKLYETILKNPTENNAFLTEAIYRSAAIKNNVVLEDPNEQNLRKVLNFGHSLGHAIESYFLKTADKPNLTHGEAIAVGMVTAVNLSCHYCDFNLAIADSIKEFIISYFGKVTISKADYPAIIDLLKHDKKAESGIVKFVLIEQIGKYQLNCNVSEATLIEALNYYSA